MGKVRGCEGSNVFVSKQAEKIFSDAVELDIAAREAFLNNTCANDAVLRREVDSLLTAAANADEFFDGFSNRLNQVSIPYTAIDGPDIEQVGPWRLLYLLGRGGMGAVYLAERADHQYQRRVALKLLSSNAADPVSRFRFQAEKNILARLQHDNIAHFIDGAVTENGMPYIVLEYIDGVPLDQYCREKSLPIRERLGLFLKVCEAVHYAHRNLVIHRDLKPANVLVDHEGNVKLLDFGIAKISGNNNAHSDLTQIGFRPVTPAYASPEMLDGGEVDITSDVYSLGIMLHELQVGGTPDFAGNRSNADGKSVTSVRQGAGIPAPSAKGELGAIIAKATKQARNERYESVKQLSDDVRNYLSGKPVSAKPDNTIYIASKLIIRHKLVASFAVFALAALLLITGLTTRFAITTSQQAQKIAEERDRAEAIKSFLINILKSADPDEAPKEITVRELVIQNFDLLDGQFSDQPYLKLELLGAFIDVFVVLRQLQETIEAQAMQMELVKQVYGTVSSEFAKSLIEMSAHYEKIGELDESLKLAEEALILCQELDNEEYTAVAYQRIGRANHIMGRYDQAKYNYENALELNTKLFGENNFLVSGNLLDLGSLANHQGIYDIAEQNVRKSLAIRENLLGKNHSDIGEVLLSLGAVLSSKGQTDEAIEINKRTLALWELHFGPDNSYSQFVINNLGHDYRRRGDYGAAKEAFEKTANLVRKFTPGHPNMGFVLSSLADVNQLMGDYVTAARNYRDALQILQEGLPDHWKVHYIKLQLGISLGRLHELSEAEALFVPAIEVLKSTSEFNREDLEKAAMAISEIYQSAGKPESAKQYQQLLIHSE